MFAFWHIRKIKVVSFYWLAVNSKRLVNCHPNWWSHSSRSRAIPLHCREQKRHKKDELPYAAAENRVNEDGTEEKHELKVQKAVAHFIFKECADLCQGQQRCRWNYHRLSPLCCHPNSHSTYRIGTIVIMRAGFAGGRRNNKSLCHFIIDWDRH